MKVSELFNTYLDHRLLTYGSKVTKRCVFKHFFNRFGDIPVTRVTRQTAEDLQTYLKKRGLKNSAVNSMMANARCVFSWAVPREEIPEVNSNPFADLRKLPKKEKEWRTYEAGEIERIVSHAKSEDNLNVAIAVLLGIYGGLRREAILNLTINEVDFDKNRITVSPKEETASTWFWEPKNGYIATFNMSEKLTGLLIEKFEQLECPYVVLPISRYNRMMERRAEGTLTDAHRKNPWQNFNRHYDNLLKRAGLPHKTIHELRKTCGTELVRGGANPKEVQAVLGHSSIDTTFDYYIAVDKEQLRGKAENILNNYCAGCK